LEAILGLPDFAKSTHQKLIDVQCALFALVCTWLMMLQWVLTHLMALFG
jgi:hypothetical protein